MSKLHHLILNNNQLVMIHQGAFNDLLALEELDLSYNNLDSIPWEAIQVSTLSPPSDHCGVSGFYPGAFD